MFYEYLSQGVNCQWFFQKDEKKKLYKERTNKKWTKKEKKKNIIEIIMKESELKKNDYKRK